jgi:hypothetical protein
MPIAVGCAVLGALLSGCANKKKPIVIPPRYATLKPKNVPPLFKDTLLERCMLLDTEPYLVNSFGVVANLHGTGDSVAPNAVRDYIVKQMLVHGISSHLIPGMSGIQPEQILRDPRFAIVQVDGYLPPGVRKGQQFDVQVSAIPGSNTTSLSHGQLWRAELRIGGANPQDPGGAVNVLAKAQGPIFVNPAYALKSSPDDPAAKRSLRFGVVLNGGYSMEDRPIGLRILAPSMRTARAIENRIDSRFQEVAPNTIAAAQDEAVIDLFGPPDYRGDWQHFINVVNHLYLNGSPEFSAAKARQLADEALKPNAPLMDISYCFEAIGKAALPVIRERELMSSTNPDIAYAAARAAAFLGDPTAPDALLQIARTSGHKFQLNAVDVLGALPSSPAVNEKLRPLLDSPEILVRIAAYNMLARNNDNAVFSTEIRQPLVDSSFALDVAKSSGNPVIYGTRMGPPRLAILGQRMSLDMPLLFSALDGRLTISSDPNGQTVTIFYRPPPPPGSDNVPPPVKIISRPDVAELVARLGGTSATGVNGLSFNYGEIVSILTAMTGAHQISAMAGGERVPATFVLQDLPRAHDSIYSAPIIPDQGRPQADEPGKVGMAR